MSGNDTGEEGGLILGANVLVKGTTVGTVTDSDANYRLKVPEEADALSFSFIIYRTYGCVGSFIISDKLMISTPSAAGKRSVPGYTTKRCVAFTSSQA